MLEKMLELIKGPCQYQNVSILKIAFVAAEGDEIRTHFIAEVYSSLWQLSLSPFSDFFSSLFITLWLQNFSSIHLIPFSSRLKEY